LSESNLTSDDFRAWRKKLRWTRAFTAKKLGVGPTAVAHYETGYRSDIDRDVKIPLLVALGMAALEQNLKPIGGYPSGGNKARRD
jgi:transcriptional regulator with XRE-family HTH domain